MTEKAIKALERIISVNQQFYEFNEDKKNPRQMSHTDYFAGMFPEVEQARKALTPESEGIAGKGDVDFSLCLKIAESVFDLVKAPQDSLLSMDRHLAAKTVQEHLSTLARPQEIDVEQLRDDALSEVSFRATGDMIMEDVGFGARAMFDHLTASGYLSAPDSREKELMAVIADFLSAHNNRRDIHHFQERFERVKEKHAAIIEGRRRAINERV